jgi:hypothetical protein
MYIYFIQSPRSRSIKYRDAFSSTVMMLVTEEKIKGIRYQTWQIFCLRRRLSDVCCHVSPRRRIRCRRPNLSYALSAGSWPSFSGCCDATTRNRRQNVVCWRTWSSLPSLLSASCCPHHHRLCRRPCRVLPSRDGRKNVFNFFNFGVLPIFIENVRKTLV